MERVLITFNNNECIVRCWVYRAHSDIRQKKQCARRFQCDRVGILILSRDTRSLPLGVRCTYAIWRHFAREEMPHSSWPCGCARCIVLCNLNEKKNPYARQERNGKLHYALATLRRLLAHVHQVDAREINFSCFAVKWLNWFRTNGQRPASIVACATPHSNRVRARPWGSNTCSWECNNTGRSKQFNDAHTFNDSSQLINQSINVTHTQRCWQEKQSTRRIWRGIRTILCFGVDAYVFGECHARPSWVASSGEHVKLTADCREMSGHLYTHTSWKISLSFPSARRR